MPKLSSGEFCFYTRGFIIEREFRLRRRLMSNREDRNNKLVIWVFVGSVLVCTLSVAIYMYLVVTK